MTYFPLGLAIMSNPYISPTGSPPQGFPMPTSYSNNSGDGMGSAYSPPSGLSPKGSPNSTPINGYTQVCPWDYMGVMRLVDLIAITKLVDLIP